MRKIGQRRCQRRLDELSRLRSWSQRPAMMSIASASIPPSSAASNTTPARSTKLNSRSKPKTKKAARCASARSAAAGVMTASSRAFAASRCRRPDFPSACRGCRPRSRCSASSTPRRNSAPSWSPCSTATASPTIRRWSRQLRNANIRAELYLGNPKNMGNQLKYADRRNSPCVIIQGSDEKARGEVQIKDLIEGAKAAAAIASNQEWRETRPAQFSCAGGRDRRQGARSAGAP